MFKCYIFFLHCSFATIILEKSGQADAIGNISGLRTFRVLRAFKTISIIPGKSCLILLWIINVICTSSITHSKGWFFIYDWSGRCRCDFVCWVEYFFGPFYGDRTQGPFNDPTINTPYVWSNNKHSLCMIQQYTLPCVWYSETLQ